jgi:two-component system, OmpR family, response regulator
MTRLLDEIRSTDDRHKNGDVLTVLHVEDDERISAIVKEILESEGWAVETCFDGRAALESISGTNHYDLLLLDYDLPGLNGLELVNMSRRIPHRCNIPIIVLSATSREADAMEAGADLFLPKPVHISTLIQAIERVCRKELGAQDS